MDFLKAILGDDLYAQIEQAVNAYNGNEANKDNQVKIANLATGDYVSKGKYSSLEAENQTNATKLTEANNLIAQLQKAVKGDEALQGQVTAYQARVQELENELKKTQAENAANLALLAAGAKPESIRYIMFELKEKGELVLGDDGKVKGMEDKITALKTQLPNHFAGDGKKTIIENRLKTGDDGQTTVTREQFKTMSFEDRMNLKKSNEELYKQYAKN